MTAGIAATEAIGETGATTAAMGATAGAATGKAARGRPAVTG